MELAFLLMFKLIVWHVVESVMYRVIAAHRNWQIESAVCNLAGFLHCALETRWQQSGRFLNDFLDEFLHENFDFHYEKIWLSLWKLLMIFSKS